MESRRDPEEMSLSYALPAAMPYGARREPRTADALETERGVSDGDLIRRVARRDANAFEASVEGVVFQQFDGCGHYLHHERPEAFVTAMRDFLDDPSAIAVRLKKIDA